MENFDKQYHVPVPSDRHSKRSSAKDLGKIVKQLHQEKVFDISPGRKHKSFKMLKANLIQILEESQLKEWMINHISYDIIVKETHYSKL